MYLQSWKVQAKNNTTYYETNFFFFYLMHFRAFLRCNTNVWSWEINTSVQTKQSQKALSILRRNKKNGLNPHNPFKDFRDLVWTHNIRVSQLSEDFKITPWSQELYQALTHTVSSGKTGNYPLQTQHLIMGWLLGYTKMIQLNLLKDVGLYARISKQPL